jgi:DNA-directed RNA polymerase specialized sigma24 family protein
VTAEGLPERLQRVLGDGCVPDGVFDRSDATQVDRVASELLTRTLVNGDPEAFALLVDVTQPMIERIADGVAEDLGLCMPADELIVALFSELFVETGSRLPKAHFLAWATEWMTIHAEAWIRDLALLDTPAPGRDVVLPPTPMPDGSSVRSPDETSRDLYAHVLKICVHRLDVDSRRLLRACDVQRLPLEQVAARFDLDMETASSRLDRARHDLTKAISKILGEDS